MTKNKHASVRTRTDRTGKLRTETYGRDPGQLDVAVTTDARTNSTSVFIDAFGREDAFAKQDTLVLDGHQARTLFLVLDKHFGARGVRLP